MHWRIILRNIFSNWLAYIVSGAVAIFLTPFVVHRLGNTGYGIWTLVLSLTGYFGLLDFGIRSSVGRFVARYMALDEPESVSRTISNAMAMLGCGSVLAVAATIGMTYALPSFHLEAQLQAPARTALLLAGANIALALPMGVFGGVLIALERYDVLSRLGIGAALTQAGLVVLALRAGHGIAAIAAITLLVTASQYTVIAVFAKSRYPAMRIGWRLVSADGCRELLGFSIYRFVYIIANQLIFYTDSVVLGAFLGAGAITPYAIAGSLITRGRDVVSQATDTLYPSASRMDGLNDRAGIRELYLTGTRLALLIGLPICLGYVLLGRQFITLWMGKDYLYSATILAVLTIPQFTSLPQYCSSLVLASMARHKLLAYLVLAEGVANLALSIILVRRMGVMGVALGTVIPHLINTSIVIPMYTLRILGLRVSEYLFKAVLRPWLCAIPFAAVCYGLSIVVEHPSWPVFVAEVVAATGAFALTAYFASSSQARMALRAKSVEAFSR